MLACRCACRYCAARPGRRATYGFRVFTFMTDRFSPPRLRRTGVRAIFLLVAVALHVGIVPTFAQAAPIDDQRAKAQALESSIHQASEKLAALYEQIKYNQDEVDQAQQTIADSQADLAGAQAEVQRVVALVRQRAVTVYQHSGRTGLTDFQTDVRAMASRRKYAEITSVRDDALLQKLARAKEQLTEKRDAAQKAKEEAETRADKLQQQQAEFQSTQVQQKQLLGQVNGEIAQLVAEEQAKRAAANAPIAGVPNASSAPTTTSGNASVAAAPAPTSSPGSAPATAAPAAAPA